MTLTKLDLKQIDLRIKKHIDKFSKGIYEILGLLVTRSEFEKVNKEIDAIKRDLVEVKDIIFKIDNYLQTEYQFNKLPRSLLRGINRKLY